MGGSNRRREQRSGAARGSSGAQGAAIKPAWRETFDAWGGYPVFVALLSAVLVVGVLFWVNRAGASAGKGDFTSVNHGPTKGRLAGNPDAPVKILEFADFQCPYCKQFHDGTGKQLFEEYVSKGTVSFQFVSFAFIGPESQQAAEAAECAADQGRFWDYHDLLYLRQGQENSGVFSKANLKRFAEELKRAIPDFDTKTFGECLDSGQKASVVAEQVKQARSAGVQSTPSFLVNGQALSGVQPIEAFRQAIDNARKSAGK